MSSKILSWDEKLSLAKQLRVLLNKEVNSQGLPEKVIGLGFAKYISTPDMTLPDDDLEKCELKFIKFLEDSDKEEAKSLRKELGGKKKVPTKYYLNQMFRYLFNRCANIKPEQIPATIVAQPKEKPRASLKKICEGPLRSFKIVIGLVEGYGREAKGHTIDEVIDIALDHLKRRADAKLPFLSGIVVPGNVCYAWKKDDNNEAESRTEPTAIYQGEVSPLYNKDLSDEDALEMLREMALEFAERLNQTRMYVSFLDKIYLFEREGTSHPRSTSTS